MSIINIIFSSILKFGGQKNYVKSLQGGLGDAKVHELFKSLQVRLRECSHME